MTYKKRCKLPLYPKEVYISKINNEIYSQMLNVISLNDEISLNDFIESLIKEDINDPSVYENLTNLDKFSIMLYKREMSLGNDMTLSLEGSTINYYINSLITNLNNIFANYSVLRSYKYNNIILNLSIPKQFIINDLDDIYKNVINNIIIEDEKISINDLTNEEYNSIIDLIPANLTDNLLVYLDELKNFSNNNYILSPNSTFQFEGVNINFFDRTFLLFIKSIFGDKLLNFYELQFVLFNKLRMDYEWFRNSTMQECKFYIKFYNEDMKRQEEASKSSSSMPSMPKMPTMPSFRR